MLDGGWLVGSLAIHAILVGVLWLVGDRAAPAPVEREGPTPTLVAIAPAPLHGHDRALDDDGRPIAATIDQSFGVG